MKNKLKLIITAFFLLILSNTLFPTDYRLQPTDTLDIQLLNNPKYNTKQAIAPDGTISLPFLGRVKAKGKTLNEFDATLKTEFAKYLNQPQLVVSLIHKETKEKPKEAITKSTTPNTEAPIMLVIHDLKKNTTEVKSVKTVQEAKAWIAAGDRCLILDKDDLNVASGDIVKIEIGQPDPDPIYVVFYDIGNNTYDLKKATTIEEARALIGGAKFKVLVRSPESEVQSQDQNQSTSDVGLRTLDVIKPGDTVKIEIGRRPDFLEDNWYKLLSGAGLVLGILNSLKN